MKKKKVAVVFGTRPEAIKMAPVVRELKKQADFFQTIVIVTAQHREMLDQVLDVFNIKPDYDLNVMKQNQTLADITTDVLRGIDKIYLEERPDMVLVHGDTTTSFAAALAAYYHKISIGHVEAGLRTYDPYFPFPEEANRQLIDTITDLYFAPTEAAKQNLLNEGKSRSRIMVTGNTVIDAIHYTSNTKSNHNILDLMKAKADQKWILLTMHRRENHGQPMKNVFEAVIHIADEHPEIEILMPVHLNPKIQLLANEMLGQHERIHLVEPLGVDVFHQIVDQSWVILTDSGGLQEEAPALDVPVLVLRDKTERPEGLEAGTLKVIGTEKNSVIKEVEELLYNLKAYEKMAKALNPYGDGKASQKIIKEIQTYFERSEKLDEIV
ncbi:non-hydrolyzing UDP-N-acetylglucosamine 2-epimerase [Atopococcus tabaci]|uniref:non-hydrolyzing UDP-N-acetylglucosamine 2-epimerase n=1 Tax=Atopococcus tabaci TaxID=269774 RepID=UPI00041A1AA7|nr:UDP-N-acetylglucosamine 2-epimerase (non-hydrolyzing) [Atopococcus tabaci]